MSDGAPSVLRVGCPMWAHRPWVGRYLPAETAVGRELEAYSQLLTAVEGNTTFYALPGAETVTRWLDLTPATFRFVLKLPRTITHDRRLRDCAPERDGFCDRFEPLLSRLGPTTIQLPPSFAPTELEVLESFLAGLSRDWTWAVEVRHPGFFDGSAVERSLNDLLATYGVERVVLDSRALFAAPAVTSIEEETHQRKPRLPVRPVAIGLTPIVRFIGQTDGPANPPYWAPWVDKVARWIQDGRSPIVFLHTPDNAVSPELARWFHAAVAARVPDLAPLPDPPEPPQTSLW